MVVRSRLLSFLALLGALAVGAAPAQAQITLRYQYKEGQQNKFEAEQKMTMKMDVDGQEIEIKMTQVMDMVEKVLSVNKDGTAKVAQRITRCRMIMDMPLGKMEFDSQDDKESDNPVAKLIGPILKGMVNEDVTMTMSPLGEVTNLKVPAKFLEALKNNSLPGLDQMFSEDSLKQMMTQSSLVLPKEAVTKGKTWKFTKEVKTPPLGKMVSTTTATYQGPVTQQKEQLDKIGLTTDVKLLVNDDAPGKMKVKVEKTEGSALFDNKTGRLVEARQAQVMAIEIEADGQTVNMRMESTATLKLKK